MNLNAHNLSSTFSCQLFDKIWDYFMKTKYLKLVFCPTLFLEIYHPVGFHSNPNKAHLILAASAGLPNPVPGDLPSCMYSLQP